jgi:hypothetical protein
VEADSPRISIDSERGRGEALIEAGSYRDVRVAGEAWTIVIRPR